MPPEHQTLWPIELHPFIDAHNPRRILIGVPGLQFSGWANVFAGIVIALVGVAAIMGVAGVNGFSRYLVGPMFLFLGLRWAHLQFSDRRRWFSVELRVHTWHFKRGHGRHEDKVIDMPIKSSSTRVASDAVNHNGSGDHLVVEDLTVRYDEPLPQVFLGERFYLRSEILDAICGVISAQAQLRRSAD